MSNFHPLEVVDRGSETQFKKVKIPLKINPSCTEFGKCNYHQLNHLSASQDYPLEAGITELFASFKLMNNIPCVYKIDLPQSSLVLQT